MKTIKTLFLVVVTTSLIGMGCGGGGSSSSPSTPPSQSTNLSALQITALSTNVPLGGTESLTAIGTYDDGHTHDITDKVSWVSSTLAVATVTPLGDVTGVSPGQVTISASSGSVKATMALTVGSAALARIDISPSAPSTPPNTTQQLIAMGKYTDGSVREVNDLVTWTSSDSTKVKVAANGAATTLSSGVATITAKAANITGSAAMTVTTAQLIRMAVLPYQPITGIGVEQHFTAVGTFDDYGTRELAAVNWSSSNPAVAMVTAGGFATPLQVGSTTIKGTVGTVSASTVMTILQQNLLSILVTPAKLSMAAGTDQQFTAKGLLTDGSLIDVPVVTWSSSDQSVASIDATGRLLSLGPGMTTISASVAGKTGSSVLNVTSAALQSIVVAPGGASVPILSMKQLYAFGTFSDGTTQDLTTAVTWWSNNSRVATVDSDGLLSSNAAGSLTISASLGGVWGAATLQVAPITVNSVTINPNNISVAPGTKLQHSLYSNLSDGSTVLLDAPRWYTSPITMATIDNNGLLTARAADSGKVYGETCCRTNFAPLTVTNAHAQSLAIKSGGLNLPAGATQALQTQASFDDGSVQDVSNAVHWTSSQPSALLVDGNGMAISSGSGTVSVNATFGPTANSAMITATPITITVVAAPLTSLGITPQNTSLDLGDKEQFSVSGTFSDGSTHGVADVTWTSSNPAVAVVLANGQVISTGKGSAVITAKSNGSGLTSTASITVQ